METVTPFITYYLYTFNDIADLGAELTCKMTSCSQRSLSMPKFQKSISVEESLSYLVSLEITFATICERCKKHARPSD
jgi:hypothetical protein